MDGFRNEVILLDVVPVQPPRPQLIELESKRGKRMVAAGLHSKNPSNFHA